MRGLYRLRKNAPADDHHGAPGGGVVLKRRTRPRMSADTEGVPMPNTTPIQLSDLLGLSRLAIGTTEKVAD